MSTLTEEHGSSQVTGRLADVTFVLDGFHISKYVGKLVQHTKDSEDDAGSEVMAAIRDGKNPISLG